VDNISNALTNPERAQRYLKFIEEGVFPGELIAAGMVMEQLPNRIYPKGLRSGVKEMAEAFDQGKKLLSSQSYRITKLLEQGDSVAMEVLWTGRLAVPLGTLSAGSEMRAYCAMFFEFHEGRIVSQRNYDCFEPW
jgi:ketosteroid isomerase-like protein